MGRKGADASKILNDSKKHMLLDIGSEFEEENIMIDEDTPVEIEVPAA